MIIFTWVIPVSIIAAVIIFNSTAFYDRTLSTCISDITKNKDAKEIVVTFTLLFIIVPYIITIMCNICMLYYSIGMSKKHPDASFKGALLTVCSISGMFTLSVTPYMVRVFLHAFVKGAPIALEIAQAHIYLINASCNPILYSITNLRFRKFIRKHSLRFMIMFWREHKVVTYVNPRADGAISNMSRKFSRALKTESMQISSSDKSDNITSF